MITTKEVRGITENVFQLIDKLLERLPAILTAAAYLVVAFQSGNKNK
ncbi:hypothetical protein [Streptococcus suis]